jgi:hypothetical protein
LANVHDNLIIAFPCPPESGSPYSLTLASRLGHMLEMAEQRFGPRDKSYTILGFEFRAGLPQIWFPGDGMNVIVQLDSANLNDPNLPLLQMAHECVHLLTPVLPANASVLEEGLATYFSKEYMASHVGGVWFTGDQKYGHAEVLARKLLLLNADAIKALRELVPVISRATAQDILKICPSLPLHFSEQLVVSFQSWDGNIRSVGAKPTKLHL